MADTFKCERCKGTFEKAWSDAEADAEMREVFGALSDEERATVCDDCYREVGAFQMHPTPRLAQYYRSCAICGLEQCGHSEMYRGYEPGLIHAIACFANARLRSQEFFDDYDERTDVLQ